MDARANVIFLFLAGNSLFGQMWSKRKKNQNCQAEISYLDQFKYAEFNGAVYFFLLDREHPFWAKVVQKVNVFNLSCNLVLD